MAESGTETLGDNWKTIVLTKNYSNPVVIAKPISIEGMQPAHIRIRNVSSSNFEMKVEEWAYLDGTHVDENVSYFVIEAGNYTLEGKKIEAGLTVANDSFSVTSFTASFTTAPIVLAQSQTVNEADPIVTRLRNVGTTSFEVRVQEEENSTDGGSHASETVGYLAAEAGLYNNVTKFEVGNTTDSVTHKWFTIGFNQTYAAPSFLADMQTFYGNNPAGLRYRNLASSSVEVKAQEETSLDAEVAHAAEVVGYFVIE